jgi:hypothetical protein
MNKMNRRAFLKKAVYVGVGLIALTGVGAGWKAVRRALPAPSAPMNPPQRKSGNSPVGSHWFTPAEFATVEALASVIVPSDGNGPGATEADVAGQLDRLVAGAPRRQEMYRVGLAAFDRLAMQQYQKAFATLGMKEQIQLFSVVDEARLAMETEPVSIQDKASRKLRFIYYYKWLGVSPAAVELCRYIVLDAKEKFYGSQVAWAWLGYEGPPFPLGYIGSVDKCAIPRA